MFIETSAIVEYFLKGDQERRIAEILATPNLHFSTSPTVIFEAASVLAGRLKIPVADAAEDLESFLEALHVEVLPITRETASLALDAFARYGKGRHPAKLNFGDCFSYAGAKTTGVKLLYVGDDFARTDLA